MKLKRRTLQILLLSSFAASFSKVAAKCEFDFGMPRDVFSGVDQMGFVSYWEKLAVIDCGGGLLLPLTVHFSSNQATYSPVLGRGWSIPLLESKLVQKDDGILHWITPNGKTISFNRDHKDLNSYKATGGFAASMRGPLASVRSDCGWAAEFRQGKLVELITPEGRQIDFHYSRDCISDISESKRSHLSVSDEVTPGGERTLTFNGMRLGIFLGERPMTLPIQPGLLISSSDRAVREFSGLADGDLKFQYVANHKALSSLKIRRGDQIVKGFEWDPRTQHIANDDTYAYTISPGGAPSSSLAITRTSNDGRSSYWYSDPDNGRDESISVAGVHTYLQKHLTGAASGKPWYAWSYQPGSPVRTVKWMYDDAGECSAKEDTIDGITNFEVSHNGVSKVIVTKRQGRVIETRTFNALGLLLTRSFPDGTTHTFYPD